MKTRPFNLEEAKAGKPVCTRDFRHARIVCFDIKIGAYDNERGIVALIDEDDGYESVKVYFPNGKKVTGQTEDDDLMMVCEPKVGWVNIYGTSGGWRETSGEIYKSEQYARARAADDCIATVRIEWEE